MNIVAVRIIKYLNIYIYICIHICNTNMVVVLIIQYTVYMHVHASCGYKSGCGTDTLHVHIDFSTTGCIYSVLNIDYDICIVE